VRFLPVLVVVSSLLGPSALAEPAPTWLYADPVTGICGELWGGDEWVVRLPASPSFVRVHNLPFTDATACNRLLGVVGIVGDPRPRAVGDAPEDRCRTLRRALDNRYRASSEQVCTALGYKFVKEIPFVTRPGVAAERGEVSGERRLLPVGLAVAGVVLVIGAAVIVRRRARRR
jgi:hypothetical protein